MGGSWRLGERLRLVGIPSVFPNISVARTWAARLGARRLGGFMVERAQGTGAVQLAAEPGGARVTLLERDAELTSVEELIVDASGRGRLLAIEGPPGIGKTSLIREARALGQEAGMEVLGARGSELESRFSFGVVRQLFEPFLVKLPDEERSELLVGAAGLSLPVFEPDVSTA